MPVQEEQRDGHKCQIFHCDRRGDRYCCFYCERKKKCKNPCLNHPDRCGQAFEEEKHE